MLAEMLEKVKKDDFGRTDREDLIDLLWQCSRMQRRATRIHIVNDLPKHIRTAVNGDDQNDRDDIRGIVDACLNFPGGLKELMVILSDEEKDSGPFQDVEHYLKHFLQKKHIIAPDPEVEMQIEQLTALITDMHELIATLELEQVYKDSAPQLDFSDPLWSYPQDNNPARIIDRVLHRLNAAPIDELGIPAILVFVERLACHTKNPPEQQRLRAWTDARIEDQAMPAWHIEKDTLSLLRKRLVRALGDAAQPPKPPPEGQISEDLHPLIKEAYNAIEQSKMIFQGMGDINHVHYYRAIDAFENMQGCLEHLFSLLNITLHLPVGRDPEQFVMELRRAITSTKESIATFKERNIPNIQQLHKLRKDMYDRLDVASEDFHKIHWYIQGATLDSEQ